MIHLRRVLSSTSKGRGLAAFAFAGLSLFLTACEGDPTAPATNAPSGGQEFVLDYATFAADISPLLSEKGCNAMGDCHGGGIRGSFELSPAATPNPGLDFTQVSLQVRGDAPAQSPLLLKPLAESAGGDPHAIAAFTSTSDSAYARILAWIDAGQFQ